MATSNAKPANRHIVRLLSLFLVLTIVLTGCNKGLPSQQGEFQIQQDSITWDGQQYKFAWIDTDGSVRWAQGDDVKLVEDERTYLEINGGSATIHLRTDTPVTVLASDSNGSYGSPWFPFVVGTVLGRQTANNQPAYRYPPTESVGRGDTIQGSTTTSRPMTGGASKGKSVGDAVSGQSGGTGSGSAASSKGTTGASGQAGGTGTGSAAGSKGTSPVGGGAGSGGAAGGKSSGGVSGAKSSGGSKRK